MATLIDTTSRERLVETLNHKQPERIPIDFGGTSVSGMHVSCVVALRELLRAGEEAGEGSRAIADAGPRG